MNAPMDDVRILKITDGEWKASLFEKGGFFLFKKRHPPAKLILTEKHLILGDSLENFTLNIPLEEIEQIEIEFEFMMPPKLKIIHKSVTSFFYILRGDFGFAILSQEEQDHRIQAYMQNWIEAINRTKDKETTIMVRCLQCKTLNPEKAKFCLECGEPLG